MLKLVIIDDQTGESKETILTPETLVQGGGLIGRHPGCDVVLESPEVSRVHGRFVYREEHYYFTDLGSTGGSQVNKEEAPTNQDFLLKPNDVIRIGGFILLVKEVQVKDSQEINDGTIQQPQQPPQKTQNFDIKPAKIEQLIFKAEELKAQGLLSQGISEFVFQGKQLVESLTFSTRFREKAIDMCQTELDAGNFCVLVEHTDHVTIWQEKKADNTGIKPLIEK
jgi:hypothetical protein